MKLLLPNEIYNILVNLSPITVLISTKTVNKFSKIAASKNSYFAFNMFCDLSSL